ncbi:MAG: universal stress protein [Desulfitobacteriia bacterium]
MKFLVCIDGSDHSEKVIQTAIQYAEALKAKVKLLYVMEEVIRIPPYASSLLEGEDFSRATKNLEHSAQEMMGKWKTVFREKGIPIETEIKKTKYDTPADVISDVSEEGAYDLIILGSRGLGGFKKFFLGSVSLRVAQQIQQNIMIVK